MLRQLLADPPRGLIDPENFVLKGAYFMRFAVMLHSIFRFLLLSLTLGAASVWAFEPPLDANYRAISLPGCNSGAANVKIMSSSADMNTLNDSRFDVFCFDPGDYRAAGSKTITVSGTSNEPKVIRARFSESPAWSLAAQQRVVLPSVTFKGAKNWIVHGVVFQGGRGGYFVSVRENSDNVIISDTLIEDCNGTCLYWGTGSDNGLIQRSVVRRTGITGQERHNVFISPGTNYPSEQLGVAGLSIIGNEFSDAAGDNMQFWIADKDNPASDIRGLLIQGNDMYMSPSMYVNSTGSPDPSGAWSCSENAIDIKVAVDGDAIPDSSKLKIVDNRFWGHRKTAEGPNRLCTASGSHAYAIILHKRESDYVTIERNIFLGTENGILVQGEADNAIIRNNLFSNVSDGVKPRGVLELTSNGSAEATGNYIVKSSRYLKAGGNNSIVRDNTIVNGGGWATTNGEDFTSNSFVGQNRYLGNSVVYDGVADRGNNEIASTAPQGQYCFTRKQLTTPESVCIANVDISEIDSTNNGTNSPMPPSNLSIAGM